MSISARTKYFLPLLVLPFLAGVAGAQGTPSKLEAACSLKLGKSASKLAATVLRESMKCRNADIAGTTTGPCPGSGNLAAIAAASGKLAATIEEKCGSVCSFSQSVRCVADHLCPPLPATNAAELCSAGAANLPFDMGKLGFPGAFCATVLGGPIVSTEDMYDCVAPLTETAAARVVDAVYGAIDNSSAISKDAAGCLSAIGKGAAKLSKVVYSGVVKCRNAIAKGKVKQNPRTCTQDDQKLLTKTAKMEAKLAKLIDKKCQDDDVLALDLCNNGIGGTADRTQAKDCISTIVRELTDSPLPPAYRVVQEPSLIDAAYPPPPACGDGVVNQRPNPYLLIGEECDGGDDSACPGACLPAGDIFECTCATQKRQRFVANGFTADLDSGWTGSSHDSGVTDGSGFVTEVSGCDCDAMSGATCVGASTDPVCDTTGHQMPTCVWDLFSTTRCDAHGNGNGKDEASDCYVCDAFSMNAGAPCDGESDCTPRCYDAAGVPTGTCPSGQSNCAPGEVCRGRCDRTQTCIFIPLGAPLPLSSGGTPTCVVNTYRDNIFGTRNIVTGEQNTYQRYYSVVHLGIKNSVPCPLCGGFCDGGGPLDGDNCEGSCSDDDSPCRFDSECSPTATCTPVSTDCPDGYCNLSLVCSGGPKDSAPCQIGAATSLFGTTSLDCPPTPNQNISGNGLEINFYPSTSEALALPFTIPCTRQGYELFDCPCSDNGGEKSQPNECSAACDAGAEYGQGCATGNSNGEFTSCVGGPKAGRACDEDSDCAPGTCSGNPSHCIGDPAFLRFTCSTNADCGVGACVDACPSGRCLPLCIPAPGDPEDGVCASGPTEYHCSGAKDVFRTCTAIEANGGCSATCSVSGTPCTANSQCPSGESCQGPCLIAQLCEAGGDGILGTFDDSPSAGICIGDNRNCFLDPIAGEGGDIYNGEGDPTNVKSVSIYCIGRTNAPAINSSAGLGGPGRLRQKGVNVTSGFATLP